MKAWRMFNLLFIMSAFLPRIFCKRDDVKDSDLLGTTTRAQFKPFLETRVYDFTFNQYRPQEVAKPVKRNTIVMLLRDVKNVSAILQRVDNSFDTAIDVTIFLEVLPYTADILAMRRSTSRNIDFGHIVGFFERPFSLAEDVGLDPFRNDPKLNRGRKWSYSHMIRFFFTDIFQLPQIFDNVEYFLRLDDDSIFTTPASSLFNLMSERKAVYFANLAMPDLAEVVEGLEQLTRDYMREKAIEPKDPERFKNAFPNDGFSHRSVLVYYNNFEICEMNFFRSPEVLNFTEKVLTSKNIFRHRWGDHALRYITLALLAKKEQVLHIEDFQQLYKYCHGPHCFL